MSRRLRRRHENELANQPMEIKNILPLMDVIFALLTFFCNVIFIPKSH